MTVQRLYNVRTVTGKVKKTRDHRWDLRVAESEDALVRAASEQADTSFTGFIRGAAVSEASRVLADRTTFELEESDWRTFMELLDRPPQLPAGLRDLFSKPSVFE
jgi:uncharacterized protein (DUF1778 family)